MTGSVVATEWESEGAPTSPFGPGGFEWESPEQITMAMAASLERQGAEVEHAVVASEDADLAHGWVRITNPADDPTVAGDVRLRIERTDGSWAVTLVEIRRHCRFELDGSECREAAGGPAPVETAAPVESAEPTESASATGGVYLALGDSVTFGVGVPRPAENGFVARVADALSDAAPAITETRSFAVPGETATGFRDRRLDDVVAAIRTFGARVELVTIGLGANEVLRTRRADACVAEPSGDQCRALVDSAIGQASGALDTILDRVRDALASHGSGATVLVLAYYNPEVEPLATETIVGSDGVVACEPAEARPGLNDRIACVAEARGAGVVDLHAAFLGRELELTRIGDGDVHPNAAGYQVIADAILDGYR